MKFWEVTNIRSDAGECVGLVRAGSAEGAEECYRVMRSIEENIKLEIEEVTMDRWFDELEGGTMLEYEIVKYRTPRA